MVRPAVVAEAGTYVMATLTDVVAILVLAQEKIRMLHTTVVAHRLTLVKTMLRRQIAAARATMYWRKT